GTVGTFGTKRPEPAGSAEVSTNSPQSNMGHLGQKYAAGAKCRFDREKIG
ncbi:hypothetical protein KI387_038484, partial [Taxus chinensis]